MQPFLGVKPSVVFAHDIFHIETVYVKASQTVGHVKIFWGCKTN